FWKATTGGNNRIDVNSRNDSQPTIEVRMSNIRPSDPWSSGELSSDHRWSVVSGTIPFVRLENNSILDPAYKRYFQARVEFHATAGQTPILEMLGVEEGFKVNVSPGESAPVYVRSSTYDKRKGE